VAVAERQTAGRGRLGRTWEAPPGSSLLVSVLLRPSMSPAHVHTTTMVAGIAASDACEEIAGFRPLLKWPNDIVVGDRKLGGILAEAEIEHDVVDAVIVGMGLNVNWDRPPPALSEVAVSAGEAAGRPVDGDALLTRFLARLGEHYGALVEPGGWRGALDNYRRLCSTLGRQVRVELAHETLTGRAVEISPEGHLQVQVPGRGVQRVVAGDVVHLRPA